MPHCNFIDEEWRLVQGFGDYEISSYGRVRRVSTCFVLKQGTDRKYKYKEVYLYLDKKQHTLSVHRLVLVAFVGPCPKGMECRHLDGDASNNHVSNLKWGTHKENMEDLKQHGTRKGKCGGENNRHTKLSWEQVREIRSGVIKYGDKEKFSRKFNVHSTTIGNIVAGFTWKEDLCNAVI